MIVNIIDTRRNNYNVYCSADFVPAYHDNLVEKATQHINDCFSSVEEYLDDVLLVEALEYGHNLNGSFTLYIYDPSS